MPGLLSLARVVPSQCCNDRYSTDHVSDMSPAHWRLPRSLDTRSFAGGSVVRYPLKSVGWLASATQWFVEMLQLPWRSPPPRILCNLPSPGTAIKHFGMVRSLRATCCCNTHTATFEFQTKRQVRVLLIHINSFSEITKITLAVSAGTAGSILGEGNSRRGTHSTTSKCARQALVTGAHCLSYGACAVCPSDKQLQQCLRVSNCSA